MNLHSSYESRLHGVPRRWMIVLFCLVLVNGAVAQRLAPLTNAADIIKMSPGQAEGRHPVQLTAVVTFIHDSPRVCFVQDKSGGVFVNVGSVLPACKAGDEVAIEGFTESGRFNPVLSLLSMRVVGRGVLPEATPVSNMQLWTGQFDCQRVRLRGFVRDFKFEDQSARLELAEGEREVIVRVKGLASSAVGDLSFAEVEVVGPTSVGLNEGRRITGLDLWVASTNDFKIVRPGSAVARQITEVVPSLFVNDASLGTMTEPARIRGTVLYASERWGIKLQSGRATLTVHPYHKALPDVGAEIEVIGWPRRSRGSNRLIGSQVKVIGAGTLPVPARLTLQEARRRVGADNLVTMEGNLLHRVVRDMENDWIVEQDGGYFEVRLPAGMDDFNNPIAAASTGVRLTGVLVNEGPLGDPAPRIRLLLRSSGDIEIISAPPWPTSRVLAVLSGTLVLHIIGLVSLAFIYRRLRRRTADLARTQVALESVNRELESRVESRTATLTAANSALRESEERFRQLATHIDEIFWMGTSDNKSLLYLSPSFERICGRSVEELYKAPQQWFELVHPEDRDEVFRIALGKPIESSYEIEYRVIRPDGGVRWLNDRAFPIRDESGKVFRVVGIAADVTERKRAEEELREQNIALSNAMPGIARLTVDGHYVTVNGPYAGMQGYEPAELVGTHFAPTIHPEDMLAVSKVYEQMVAHGKGEGEVRGVRKDGTIFWKQAMFVRITAACGKMTGFHCFIRDITARKRDELLLEGQKSVLETNADGAPLHETLDALARFVESQTSGVSVAVQIAAEDGSHLKMIAGPTVPEEIGRMTQFIPIAAGSGSCGTSAYLRQRVVVADIGSDPLFAAWKEPFLAHDLRACTSAPVLGSQGEVLGALCLYFRAPRIPTAEEEHLIYLASQLAAIAMERELTQGAERIAQERYRGIVDNATDAVITFDDQLVIEVFNHAAETMFGCGAADAAGRKLEEFIPPCQHTTLQQHLKLFIASGNRPGLSVPITGLRKDGSRFPLEASLSRSTVRGRALTTAILRDLTEKQRAERTRLQLESRLRQAQKMEAIGTLAGGIAHDFNNILGAVMLNIELARGELPSGHPAQEYLAALRGSSLRARDLVRQILAFSRQQDQQRHVLRLERIVEEALKLIRAALPATIEINLRLTSDGPSILADSTQVHQILTNLSANAAYAMQASGGRLDIQQRTIEVDDAMAAGSPDLQPGRYVELSIADTGTGMPPEIIDRIFDPFFTTKGPGEGTGLGLAVVHGIMKDHDGAILVESAPGRGTSFRLFFPAVEQPETVLPEDRQALARGQGERVLIVDDEEALLRVNQRTLERLGYKVTAHSNPTSALAAFRATPGDFDVVITDLAMPGMTGMDLSREFLKIRPGCPILLTTGYTTTLDQQNIKSLGLAGLIFKPATAASISEAVHDALYEEKAL